MAVEACRCWYRLGPDDTDAVGSEVACSGAGDSADADVITINPTCAAEVAAAILAEPSRPFRFAFDTAVSPVAAEHWRQTVALVCRVAHANADRPDGGILADHLAELLTTAAQTCFRTAATPDTASARARPHPASLQRATAWIDSHLDQPISMTDIAAAAGVSPRALNLTFHRHLDATPMGYVRRARLDRAHHDLEAASPRDGTTVTEIAARWGFYSLPRFGVTYRKAYGHPPSRTLRNS